MMLLMLNFWLLLCLKTFNADELSCDNKSGPSGLTECVLLSARYNDYQWATCLTNAYATQRSGGKYHCLNPTSTYCWFQCMLETYDSMGPAVTGKCKCKPGNSFANVAPSSCQSPNGNDCNWYKDCLEATYPCSGTNASYAVDFGYKYCRFYEDNYRWLSSNGKKWVEAARKCLQVSLVDLLRSYYKPTCQEIAEKAFKSHESCYLRPFNGPSICDLCKWNSRHDFFVIFWTLKSIAVTPSLWTPAFDTLLQVGLDCSRRRAFDCFSTAITLGSEVYGAMKYVKLGIQLIKYVFKNNKRSINLLTPNDVANAIATSLQWDASVLDWYGFVENVNKATDSFQLTSNNTVNVMVVVKDAFVMKNGTTVEPTAAITYGIEALNYSISKLQTDIIEGSLILSLNGETIYVTHMTSCNNALCKDNQTLAVAPSYSPSKLTARQVISDASSNSIIFWTFSFLLLIFSTLLTILI